MMKELFEKYTDSEIMKYYSNLTVSGRQITRTILLTMTKVRAIYEGDIQVEFDEIQEMYMMIEKLIPEEIWQEICECFEQDKENVDLLLEMSQAQENTVVVGIVMLMKLYEGMQG